MNRVLGALMLLFLMVTTSCSRGGKGRASEMADDNLTNRLQVADTLPKADITNIIEELGRRESTNAVDVLFAVLTFSSLTESEQLETGGRLSTYEGRYPALMALSKIPGVSVSNCVQRLNTVEPKSTEEVLLIRLAILVNREAFRRDVEKERTLPGERQERWQRIADTYLYATDDT